MDTLKDKVVKIRKEQVCWGCATKFEKGSKLRYTVVVDSGDFSSTYWCQVCYLTTANEELENVSLGSIPMDFEHWHDNARHIPQTY